jgi:FMN phosphatase YigB (HAD superfamily)
MIRAILFDMDDTLLSINLSVFIARYHQSLARLLGAITRQSAVTFAAPLVEAFFVVDSQRREDTFTNNELYCQTISRISGFDYRLPELQDALAFFDREVLPGLNNSAINAHPRTGALETLAVAQNLGLEVALATNPSFTAGCIETRMGWGRLSDVPFKRVSSMENSRRTKPSATYYEEFIHACGWEPEECLMVGNDRRRDFARPSCGLATAYVGHAPRALVPHAFWAGSMLELSRDLPRVVDALNARS